MLKYHSWVNKMLSVFISQMKPDFGPFSSSGCCGSLYAWSWQGRNNASLLSGENKEHLWSGSHQRNPPTSKRVHWDRRPGESSDRVSQIHSKQKTLNPHSHLYPHWQVSVIHLLHQVLSLSLSLIHTHQRTTALCNLTYSLGNIWYECVG